MSVGTGPGQWTPPPPPPPPTPAYECPSVSCWCPLVSSGKCDRLHSVSPLASAYQQCLSLPFSICRQPICFCLWVSCVAPPSPPPLPPPHIWPWLPFRSTGFARLSAPTTPISLGNLQHLPASQQIFDLLNLKMSTLSQKPPSSLRANAIPKMPGDSKHTFPYWGDVSSVEETCLQIPDPLGTHSVIERVSQTSE